MNRTKRQRTALEITRLRDNGMLFREIADRIGLTISTVHAYYHDPDGTQAKARKARYDHPCVDCGKTINQGSPNMGVRCRPCTDAAQRAAGQARVIDAINRWADLHGGIPPSAHEWHNSTNGWPVTSNVQQLFGSWNAGIRAAGFETRDRGCYGRDGEDPAVVAHTAERYLAGMSTMQIADEDGVTATAVAYRLDKAGVPRRSMAEAVRLRWDRDRQQPSATGTSLP